MAPIALGRADSQLQASDLSCAQSASALLQEIGTFSAAAAPPRKRKRGVSTHLEPNGAGRMSTKLDIRDFNAVTGNPRLLGPLTDLIDDPQQERRLASSDHQQRLEAPIPNAIQLRDNRKVAYDKTKETLGRWLDTVKSMRDAEQLVFPLAEQGKLSQKHNHATMPAQHVIMSKKSPTTLEAKVIQALSTNTPIKRTLQRSSTTSSCNQPARIAHLRMERELIIRREVKAKRLKRIKSKTYRRIMKKESQKVARQTGYPDPGKKAETGSAYALDAIEQYKESTLLGHDQEELRPPMLPEQDDPDYARNLTDTSNTRLSKMKFMTEAEKRRLTVGPMIESSVAPGNSSGRRVFHGGLGIITHGTGAPNFIPVTAQLEVDTSLAAPSAGGPPKPGSDRLQTNPWLSQNTGNAFEKTSLSQRVKALSTNQIPNSKSVTDKLGPHIIPERSLDSPGVYLDPSLPTSHLNWGSQPGVQDPKKFELLSRAFAGDNVLEEALKSVEPLKDLESGQPAGSLPGWGSWSNPARRDHSSSKPQGKHQSVGHKPRRDNVTIGSKSSKKSAKYLASNVPFPFETREQYERSLRFPMGQEWSTKRTHQALSAPKIIVETGKAIAPLSVAH
ncbi:hypothetical protein DRE_07209 [Drechslerella stenobrocha 248]|uniref:Uncharacterized protein n=1 Tax=Drechslerella stenobrocha 248 TaxID=1043628 RepID=W7HLV6_9PEZI|nr:hypothetical protein DRE_07209 [Drechslerella stenobrocha 248]